MAQVLAILVFVIALAGQMTFERFGLANPLVISERLFGVLAALVVAVPVAFLLRSRQPHLSRPRTLMAAWAFIVLLLASYLWAQPTAGLNDAVIDLLCLLGLLVLTTIGLRWSPRAFAHTFVWATASTGLVYSVVGLLSVSATGRVSVFGGGPNVYGRVCALGAIACLYLALRADRQRWLWFALPLTLTGTVMSGSRGALVSLFVAFVLCGWRLLGEGFQRRLSRTLSLTALCAVGAIILQERLRPVIERRFIQLTLEDRYDSGRTEPYRQAVRIFRENPLVGSGLHGFEADYGYLIAFAYPHNLVLQVAAELGVIGLLVLLWVIVSSTRLLRRPLRRDPLIQANVACALAVLVGSQFSGDYYDARFGWIYLFIAAALARPGATSHPGGGVHDELVHAAPDPKTSDRGS